MVSVQEEWEANVLTMEQRECQLRVEMDEWKEALDRQERQASKLTDQLQTQANELEQRSMLITEQERQVVESALGSPLVAVFASQPRRPPLTNYACHYACGVVCVSLQQQLIDLQHEMVHTASIDSQDTSSRPEGYAARPLPSSANMPYPRPFPFPYPPSKLSLSSSTISTSAAPAESPYEDVVELHETVHSLRSQLAAASSELCEWKQRAEGSEARVKEMVDELSTLRRMCGDEDEVARWRMEQQRRARQEMREWRRHQEEQSGRVVHEREQAATERRKEDEQRQARSTQDASRELFRSLALARELHSLWRSAAGDSSAVDRGAVSPSASMLDLSSLLHAELLALHQHVLDHRARQMLEQGSGQCAMQ